MSYTSNSIGVPDRLLNKGVIIEASYFPFSKNVFNCAFFNSVITPSSYVVGIWKIKLN